MRVAIIGMGSNSLRMLIADVQNNTFQQVTRARDGLRVFAALSTDAGGIVSTEMISQAANAIQNMKNIALELKCEVINLFATSATRDCVNKDEFLGAILEHTGLHTDVLSGNQEAMFSFLGATNGKSGGVIDIGGGSTEVAIGTQTESYFMHSFQLGAVRLFRKVPIQNTKDALHAVELAKQIIAEKQSQILAANKKLELHTYYGVGGTFTSLAALVQNIPWSQYEDIHNFIVSKETVYNKMLELADMSVEERSALISMQKSRADIIVNGIAVLYACMDCFHIKEVCVSTKGNLEGYLIHHLLSN